MSTKDSKTEQPCTLHSVKRCYYDDDLCGGKIIKVNSFHKYLCEKCKKEDDSVPDDCGDIHDFSISDRQ